MKYFIYFLMISTVGLIVYSATFLNFNRLLAEDSAAAAACVVGGLCVLVLLSILLISRKIKEKVEEREGEAKKVQMK